MSQLKLHMQEALEALNQKGRLRTLKTIESDQGPVIVYKGKSYINFSSNNYLGLANHKKLMTASMKATQKYGTGSGASRLITGSMKLHEELEFALAQFKGTEAALVFNSGYHANIGLIPALMGKNDFIFSDELNHASLIDGCRLSQSRTKIYRHCDLNHLEKLLKKNTPGKKLIITDSVFSMDGDLAPLPELLSLCEKFDASLLVDEAHATGIFGKKGCGLVEHFGLNPRHERLIQMGTLGKALGSFGAYICGAELLRDFLINKSRAFIYTTSLPPGVLAASKAALECVIKMPTLRQSLWKNVAFVKNSLQNIIPATGWQMGRCESPIIPIIIGPDKATMRLSENLFQKGLWVTGIRPPTVAEGMSRLRITLMGTHTRQHLKKLIGALKENS
ncbi:MAG: hypothetical protein ACD_73C00341G0001 [uncultured bacterium]|nr:MAG: hypothetical protein ACD_73C00341G0001 [uncultured bacterium]